MVGCPDPEKSFDDYLAREEALPDAPDMGATSGRCDDDLDATGLYLVSVNTNLSPGTPLLFEGYFIVEGSDNERTAQLTLVPLTVDGKVPVEDLADRPGDEPIVTESVPLDAEGRF